MNCFQLQQTCDPMPDLLLMLLIPKKLPPSFFNLFNNLVLVLFRRMNQPFLSPARE